MASKILEAVYRDRRDELAALLAAAPTLTMCEAAALGDAARVRAIARAEPARVHERSDDGWTPLHLAAHFDRGDVVEALLAAGADVHAWSSNTLHNQPLHAALAGRAGLRIMMALLAKGADVNAVEHGGYTPLHLATARQEPVLVETLLARGANASARTDAGETALTIAERRGNPIVARRLRGELP